MWAIIEALKQNHTFKKVLIIMQYSFMFAYVFSLPSFSGRFPTNIISYVFMAFLILSTITYVLLYSRPFLSRHLFIIPVFVTIALFSTIFSSRDIRSWLTIFMLSITFFTFYYTFLSLDNPRFCVKLIVLAFICFSVYFIAIYFKDIINYKNFDGDSFRLGEYFDNVNHVASYFMIAFILSAYLVFYSLKKSEILYSLSSALFAFLGFTTGSRTFIITVLVAILVIVVMRFKRRRLLLIISLASVVVAFVILINLPFLELMKNRLFKFFETFFAGDGYDSSSIMRYLWQRYALNLGFKKLILGYGVNGFALYSGVGTYAHADYAEVICDFGIFGFLAFYMAIIYPLILYFKKEDKAKLFVVVLTFVIVFVVKSFMSVFYYDKATYLIFAIIFYAVDNEKYKNNRFGLLPSITDYMEVVI